MALLKATQPQADLSLQALMFRLDQLEKAVGVSAAAPAQPTAQPVPQQRPAPRGAVSAAVAPKADESPQPVGSIDLDQIVTLWPAVSDALLSDDRDVLAHALAVARPIALENGRLTIAFPSEASFVKKKAEQGRDHVANAVRGITGQPLAVAFELSELVAPAAGPATLDHEQLIERLRAEFDAEEVFDEEKD
jgi:hypothetical protein